MRISQGPTCGGMISFMRNAPPISCRQSGACTPRKSPIVIVGDEKKINSNWGCPSQSGIHGTAGGWACRSIFVGGNQTFASRSGVFHALHIRGAAGSQKPRSSSRRKWQFCLYGVERATDAQRLSLELGAEDGHVFQRRKLFFASGFGKENGNVCFPLSVGGPDDFLNPEKNKSRAEVWEIGSPGPPHCSFLLVPVPTCTPRFSGEGPGGKARSAIDFFLFAAHCAVIGTGGMKTLGRRGKIFNGVGKRQFGIEIPRRNWSTEDVLQFIFRGCSRGGKKKVQASNCGFSRGRVYECVKKNCG